MIRARSYLRGNTPTTMHGLTRRVLTPNAMAFRSRSRDLTVSFTPLSVQSIAKPLMYRPSSSRPSAVDRNVNLHSTLTLVRSGSTPLVGSERLFFSSRRTDRYDLSRQNTVQMRCLRLADQESRQFLLVHHVSNLNDAELLQPYIKESQPKHAD